MVWVPVQDEVRIFSHIIETDLGVDNFAISELRHKPATHFPAYTDLFIVHGSVRLLWVNRIVQLLRRNFDTINSGCW